MSLRTMLERSKDALLSLVGLDIGIAQEPVNVDDTLLDAGWSKLVGNGNGNGNGHSAFGYGSYGLTDLRNLFFWIAVLAILVLFAVVTNPNETSFRSHLTELSFRRHLADIRRSETDDSHTQTQTALSDEHAQSPSSTSSSSIPSSSDKHVHAHGALTVSGNGNGVETPTHTIAPFRFANHVAISLRTPTLLYRSFFVLSITITSPLTSPAFLSDHSTIGLPKSKHTSTLIKERHVLWVGFMGHWTLLGLVPSSVEWIWKVFTRSEREKGRKKGSNMDKAGILDMRAVQDKEDPTTVAKALLAPTHSTPKNLRRTDSTSNITDVASLHPGTTATSLAPNGIAPESRRPSLANLIAQPATTAVPDSPEIASSPILTALKTELAAAQNVLTDLQSQLSAHEQLVSDAHSHLQVSLDDLRTRRKEDDAERQELKAKTKSLEEQKRQAEAARREAEKKLKAAEAVRDGLEAKITTAEGEIRELRGQMESSERTVRVLQEEGAKHVVETQQAVEDKKGEVVGLEEAIGDLEGRSDELGNQVRAAEEKLKAVVEAGEAAKRLGPEEEMMMMAAAYEAAAQEGYHQGYQHPHSHSHVNSNNDNNNSNNSSSQWASQAAAYMAEAGMPHLGYEYTARPTHSSSTGFGHLSRHPNSNSQRDLNELKRITDVSGFEDFGPGAVGKARRRSSTPLQEQEQEQEHQSDSESDIYGHFDPGSPNGGISSSFSANLLPQGLFRSLEGDQTPLVGADEDLPVTFAEPLRLDGSNDDDHVHDHNDNHNDGGAEDSGSDSGDEEGDIWRSPMPEPGQLLPSNSNAKRLSGGFNSGAVGRLLPPSSGMNSTQTSSTSAISMTQGGQSHNITPPSMAPVPTHGHGHTNGFGLPALQLSNSRRWFSGSSGAMSSDNLNLNLNLNLGFMHPTTSNDSLNLISGESPFAPTSSEKKALAAKWTPFAKRWGNTNATNSTTDNNNNVESSGSGSGGWPITKSNSNPSANGGFASSPKNGNGNGNGNLLGSSYDSNEGEGKTERTSKPFKLFSLRKPGTGTSPS